MDIKIINLFMISFRSTEKKLHWFADQILIRSKRSKRAVASDGFIKHIWATRYR